MRRLHYAALVGALALGGTLAHGTGTITTVGATIDSGAAPSKGQVVVNDCAPPGTFPGLPNIPGVTVSPVNQVALQAPNLGASGDGSFVTGSSQTIAGGTYEYDDYDITGGAQITYSGAVTIRVDGRCRINGIVRTTAAGASITIHCNRVELIWGDPQSTDYRVSTTGTGADIEIIAIENASIGGLGSPFSRGRITSDQGNVVLGVTTPPANGSLAISRTDVDAPNGTVDVNCAGPVNLSDAIVDGAGPVQVFCMADTNGRALNMLDDAYLRAAMDADVLVEAETGGMELFRTAGVQVSGGKCLLRAAQGGITVTGGCEVTNTDSGVIEIEASGRVWISNGGKVESDMGRIDLRSSTSNVFLQDGTSPASVVSSGDILCEGGGSIGFELNGSSTISTMGGNITVRAPAGEVYAAGLDANVGILEINASDSVYTSGLIEADQIVMTSDGNAVVDGTVTSFSSLSVTNTSQTSVSAVVTARDALSLVSNDDITLTGATVTTTDATGTPSGSILIETHFAFGTINADGATVRSGTSDASSGSVSLLVSGGGQPGPTAIDAFIAPKSIRARIKDSKPEKSFLTISGTLDTGTLGTVAAGVCKFDFGTASIGGDLVAKGRAFQLVTDDATLRLIPPRAGNSKTRLSFRVKRDLTGIVQADSNLLIRFTQGVIDAPTMVALENFRFKQGRNPGALTDPDIFPVSCRAGVRGQGRDSLTLKLFFPTIGVAPGTAPDVSVGFGNSYSVTVPGAEFGGPARERFTAKRPDSAPAVSKATLDYRRELLTIAVRNVDLGAFPAGDTVPVTIEFTLGPDQRAVDVVLARKGSNLVY